MLENEKVHAINIMPQPPNVKDLKCFMGMVNYLKSILPRLAELGDSFRELTKKNIPFIWGPEYAEVFDAIKKEITSKASHIADRCKLEKSWCCPPSRGP